MKTYEIKAFDIDYKGQGIAKIDEKIIFVKNLFEGEVADIMITKSNKNFLEGKVINLLTKSKDRVSDLYFDYAPLYGLSLEKECLWQQKVTKETLKKISNLDVEVSKTITDGKKLNYRNKVVLHTSKKNKVEIGVYKENSRNLKYIESHVLAHERINDVIRKLNTTFNENKFQDDTLKHVTLRTNGTEVMVILSLKKKSYKEEVIMVSALKEYVDSIYLNYAFTDFQILGDTYKHIYGLETLKQSVGNLTYEVGPVSFFQVNESVGTLMYDYIKEHVTGKTVIDAYAGVATISQYLDKDKTIYAIESNKDAVNQAKIQIEKNHLKNIHMIEGDVEIELKTYIKNADSIIFDPPRSGLSRTVVELLLGEDIKQIIYVSCDVKTLARDLGLLSTKYDIKSVTPFRMFPSTNHVESITLLFLKTA